MSIRYAAGNLINVNTLSSVSTEDTIYVKEFIYNARQSKPFRMTAKTGNVVCDLGSDRPTILGILNHNLSSAATITLQANSSDSWGSPPYSQTITWNELNIWFAFSQDYQWWRLVISDTGNASNLSFGEIVLTTWASFSKNYDWNYLDTTRYIKSDKVTSHGQRWRSRLAKGKAFNVKFTGVTDANLVSEIETFFEAFDGAEPFIFIPDNTKANCWYVECLNNLEARRKFLNTNNFPLILEEQTRGIELL